MLERARKYGIHPMSPSVSENLSVGKRSQKVAQISSPKVASTDAAPSAMVTLGGASVDTCAPRDDEPTCEHSTVSVSHAAANSGSQKSEWIDGICSASGFSENVTACTPLSARRWISPAASSASNSGRMPHGMKRSGYAPHHSSTCQSLYAWIITMFTSRSGPWFRTWPAKPVQFGKFSPAS